MSTLGYVIDEDASHPTEVPIRKFMAKLFHENETQAELFAFHYSRLSPHAVLMLHRPFEDETIEDIIRACYALKDEVLASLGTLSPGTCTSRIRIWRSEYNRGLWASSGQPCTYHSFRYGPAGFPINRHHNQLSDLKIKEAILSCQSDPRRERYLST